MATPATARLMTAEEFERLPDPPHGEKMELVEGKVVTQMPVGRPHARIAGRLAATLVPFVDAHRLGEIHVELGHRTRRAPDSVRAPDVSFLATAALAAQPEEGFLDGAPTLAIEVLSPDDRVGDIAKKVAECLSAGAGRVWVVRPAERTASPCTARMGPRRPIRRATRSPVPTPASPSMASRSL
ncbi:MAG: Uma2 family endonuclease [Tepidiformaceae bacterium]